MPRWPQKDSFTFDEVARRVMSKMIRRHPHVLPKALLQTAKL